MPSPHEETKRPVRIVAVCAPGSALDSAAQLASDPAAFRLAQGGPEQGRWAAVERVSNLYRFIADFVENPAAVVFLDVDEFHPSDFDAVRLMREMQPDVRIIAVFSLGARDKAAAILEAGADAYLIQPFYPAEFRTMLATACRMLARRALAPAPPAAQDYLAAVRRLAVGLGHEINNPLATISGWFQMFAEDEHRDPEERARFRSLMEEGDRIAEVVRRLVDFGQERPPARTRIVLDELVRAALDAERQRTAANGLELHVALEARDAAVLGDPAQLRRAVEMLLDDARHAIGGHGRLRVTTTTDEGNVVLRIADNGRALNEQERGRLAEPYAARTRSPNDLALVYAACHAIVHSHGGYLEATVGEDGDNVFTVRLPLAWQA